MWSRFSSRLTSRSVLTVQTSARPGVTPTPRSQHSVRHLFELPPKQFEVGYLVLNGGELLPNECEQPETERGTWRTV